MTQPQTRQDALTAIRRALNALPPDMLTAQTALAAEHALDAMLPVLLEWLHSPEALWEIEKAKRDGCPEYAADRVAEAVQQTFGSGTATDEKLNP